MNPTENALSRQTDSVSETSSSSSRQLIVSTSNAGKMKLKKVNEVWNGEKFLHVSFDYGEVSVL
jgi:hypothetical protein